MFPERSISIFQGKLLHEALRYLRKQGWLEPRSTDCVEMRLEIKTGICQVCILNVFLQNNRNLLSNRLETVVLQPQFCELCEECFRKPCHLSWAEPESRNSNEFPGDTMLLAQGPHSEDDCPRAGASFALLKMGCRHVPWTQL